MDFTLLIAAFGGGLLATMLGGLNSFIICGLAALAAILGGQAGAPAIGLFAFGPAFGPHVAFAGGVAASAFAKTRNLIENGQDIVTPLATTGDPMVLLVGGIFGMIGFIIQYIVSALLGPVIFSGILGTGATAWTDTVACTVVLSAIIVRLVFGKTGLTGKTPAGETREYVAKGQRLGFVLMMGLGLGLLSGGVVSALGNLGLVGGSETALYLYKMAPTIFFAFAAITLVFITCGFGFECWHHVGYPAASTAVIIFTATLSPVAAIIGAAITGMFTMWFGDFILRTFNSHADTHIDPPACTIFVMQTINLVILGGLIFVA
ncbi:hypothetical protein GH810_03020 [Acetobacterium paludosum]|uniref:DUF7973 domain-containing protein n=1 Tax=Acetobacterium paludosum TaxID=52693 RepID=A0A923I1A3_9FIRM|nr:hypothetical protein [Acetobacterium paludosum]MBC3887280.1 hypothetical protein [Acetobacterium paludosum]